MIIMNRKLKKYGLIFLSFVIGKKLLFILLNSFLDINLFSSQLFVSIVPLPTPPKMNIPTE